jgi:hypothetical protein
MDDYEDQFRATIAKIGQGNLRAMPKLILQLITIFDCHLATDLSSHPDTPGEVLRRNGFRSTADALGL